MSTFINGTNFLIWRAYAYASVYSLEGLERMVSEGSEHTPVEQACTSYGQ